MPAPGVDLPPEIVGLREAFKQLRIRSRKLVSAQLSALNPGQCWATQRLRFMAHPETLEELKLDLERARKALTHPILFDGRNLFDPLEMEKLGFIYKSVGR